MAEKEHLKIGMSGWIFAVPATLVAALWFFVQLLQWRKHGDDYMLTVANIIVTLLFWVIAIFAIVRYRRMRGLIAAESNKQIAGLEADVANWKARVEGAQAATAAVRKDVAIKSADIEHLNSEVRAKQKELDTVSQWGAALNREVSSLHEKLRECSSQLAKFTDGVPSPEDPRIILEFNSDRLPFPAWEKFPQERPVFLRNIGRSEALDVKIEDVIFGDVTAKFKTIALVLSNSPIGVRPDITSPKNENLAGIHEFEVLLQKAWFTFTLHGPDDQLSGQSLKTEITIKYQDSSRIHEFSTSATVTYDQSTGVTQASNFVHLRQRREKGDSKAMAMVLPELRPDPVPVGYNKMPTLPVLGFEMTNDGEPAYDFSIPEVKLGTSVVYFEGRCQRLTKTDPHIFWRVLIRNERGIVNTGNALMEVMLKEGKGDMDVAIHYRDRDLWYATICKFEVNVRATESGGITIRKVEQKIIPAPVGEKGDSVAN